MSDPENDEIKLESYNTVKDREVVLIVKHDYGYQIHHWLPDGVAPSSDYDTAQEAAARALQLVDLREPVKPQDWPERFGIGGA